MSKNLVIVESPSKAKTIGKYLGPDYTVKASMGHLRDLPKSTMGVDIEGNFEPEYVAVAGKDNTGRLLRATGDMLTIDAATGNKVLTGQRVTLGDAHNTHIITGKDAGIHIDARNNIKITGSKHTTHATKVREQLNKQNNTKSKK